MRVWRAAAWRELLTNFQTVLRGHLNDSSAHQTRLQGDSVSSLSSACWPRSSTSCPATPGLTPKTVTVLTAAPSGLEVDMARRVKLRAGTERIAARARSIWSCVGALSEWWRDFRCWWAAEGSVNSLRLRQWLGRTERAMGR